MNRPDPLSTSAISVAMATYNGAKNLSAQLDSLTQQTVRPAELVVCDDGSTDATIAILAQFASTAPFPVFIHRNAARLGPAGNFFEAARRCSREFVAFCDQDDTWRPAKLATCGAALRRWSADVLLHRYVTFRIDSFGRTVVDPDRPSLPHKVALATDLGPTLIWLGMAMVVRRTLVERAAELCARWKAQRGAVPHPDDRVWHENWGDWHDIGCLMAALEGGTVAMVNRILADHRTMDGGLFSDPAGQANAFTLLTQINYPQHDADKYRRLAMFYRRMAVFFENLGDSPATVRHFLRWEELSRSRAMVRDRTATRDASTKAWRELAALRAYRSRWSGGEGIDNLLWDARALVRPRPAA